MGFRRKRAIALLLDDLYLLNLVLIVAADGDLQVDILLIRLLVLLLRYLIPMLGSCPLTSILLRLLGGSIFSLLQNSLIFVGRRCLVPLYRPRTDRLDLVARMALLMDNDQWVALLGCRTALQRGVVGAKVLAAAAPVAQWVSKFAEPA